MMQLPQQRCTATTRHNPTYSLDVVGIQCKFTAGHSGEHAGHPGFGQSDVFWSDDPVGVPAVAAVVPAAQETDGA